jgi:hypothetical protein
MGPVVAPAGTVAMTTVSEAPETSAGVPLKPTERVVLRPEPSILTLVPGCVAVVAYPCVGENRLIAGISGICGTLKGSGLDAFSPAKTTIEVGESPLVPSGTFVVIRVSDWIVKSSGGTEMPPNWTSVTLIK